MVSTRAIPLVIAAALALGGIAHAEPEADGIVIAQKKMLTTDVNVGVQGILSPKTIAPKIGTGATALEYTEWARQALSMHNLAEAELSLEWADARLRVSDAERALDASEPTLAYDKTCSRPICSAMQDIGLGDLADAKVKLQMEIAELKKVDASRARGMDTVATR